LNLIDQSGWTKFWSKTVELQLIATSPFFKNLTLGAYAEEARVKAAGSTDMVGLNVRFDIDSFQLLKDQLESRFENDQPAHQKEIEALNSQCPGHDTAKEPGNSVLVLDCAVRLSVLKSKDFHGWLDELEPLLPLIQDTVKDEVDKGQLRDQIGETKEAQDSSKEQPKAGKDHNVEVSASICRSNDFCLSRYREDGYVLADHDYVDASVKTEGRLGPLKLHVRFAEHSIKAELTLYGPRSIKVPYEKVKGLIDGSENPTTVDLVEYEALKYIQDLTPEEIQIQAQGVSVILEDAIRRSGVERSKPASHQP
ncbi:MAG: hypothetical protein C5B49_05235, partial [Bdellovibrio sp.]